MYLIIELIFYLNLDLMYLKYVNCM